MRRFVKCNKKDEAFGLGVCAKCQRVKIPKPGKKVTSVFVISIA